MTQPAGPASGGDAPGRGGSGGLSPEERGEHVYDLFSRGTALLEAGDFAAATVPLERARAFEPDKTSIREALGRAYFRAGRYAEAREEFAAVVERAPVNDFAHFCLGRSLEKTGRPAEARRHLVLAACLRPDRADYRAFRDRLRAA
ncbi:MAG: tetratricopeptide repeat protein [Thermoleophilaceae bacterium]